MTSGFGESGQGSSAGSVVFPTSFGSTATNVYAQISSVPNGSLTNVLTYVVPVGKTFFLQMMEAGGDNIGHYTLEVNGSVIGTARTWFNGPFIERLRFDGIGNVGLPVAEGIIIRIKVIHYRPVAGTFEGRLIGVLK